MEMFIFGTVLGIVSGVVIENKFLILKKFLDKGLK